jgi:hypothetical protein
MFAKIQTVSTTPFKVNALALALPGFAFWILANMLHIQA